MKLGHVTYGQGETQGDGRVLGFLEWTDDDRLVRRMGPTAAGDEFWSIAVRDIERLGGMGLTLKIVPKAGFGETQTLHFADRNRAPKGGTESDIGAYEQYADESGAASWEAELRGAGVPSRYRTASTVTWMVTLGVIGLVVVGGIVYALVR